MAGFSNLPSELILMLWHRVEVDGFYNFSTASKRVYSLSREMLREHCDLKCRLSTISNQGPQERGIIECSQGDSGQPSSCALSVNTES